MNTTEYSPEVCKVLEKKCRDADLHRPLRIKRYEAGTELSYKVRAVGIPGRTAKINLIIEKFIGGGFAGQVYKVKVQQVTGGPVPGIEAGDIHAMKILIPPSGFSVLFRNILYGIGFQGTFQLQTNPAASMAGALWQKFIRRGAKIRFKDEKAVNDIHAVFVDSNLGSCGEISDWVEGRTWQLEVDERMDLLKQWNKGKINNDSRLGSAEFRAKKRFMHDFVTLLNTMGAYEFARQYEWSTCKSQPNCLKRCDIEDDPEKGLVAVDFRAGLALLPFLPMSPGDIKLIIKGLFRGSLVQFDRGSIEKLEKFISTNKDEFSDMSGMLDELKTAESIYRNSIPDITHNHFRLLYSRKLWSTMLNSTATGCRIRNIIDKTSEEKLKNTIFTKYLFWIIGFVPFLGSFIRKMLGHSGWRRHYTGLLTSWDYLKRAVYGKIAEAVIVWHRAGRIDEKKAMGISESLVKFLFQLPFSILPAGVHKICTSWSYFINRLDYYLARPIRLYFNCEEREQWLRDMVQEGQDKRIVSKEDAEVILSKIKEPFIQKYLKSLAVHVCTLPVTQVVSVAVAVIYVLMHPEMPRAQSWAIGLGIIALFQVVPISPGSLTRGLYVLYLVIKERNFKDYNIAVFLGFFKYIGYLAFPIQMTYRYPELARFMAAHWATDAVHVVPVFGEGGALLEHWVFGLFYNWPLTIRLRMHKRAEVRSKLKKRSWHMGLCAVFAAIAFSALEFVFLLGTGEFPGLKDMWFFALVIPVFCGMIVTLGAGGSVLSKRIISSVAFGVLAGLLYTGATFVLSYDAPVSLSWLIGNCVWRVFVFSALSVTGAVLTELLLSNPDLQESN